MPTQYDLPDNKTCDEAVYPVGDAENGDLVAITKGSILTSSQNQKGELIIRILIEPGYEDYIFELGKSPGHTFNIFFRRIRGRKNWRNEE
jgi:hypothetical protein